jgi:lysophosphatidiate acyltransferase
MALAGVRAVATVLRGAPALAYGLAVAPTYALVAAAAHATMRTLWLPHHMVTAIDDALYASYQSLVAFFYEHYAGIDIVFHGDCPLPENAIYFSNHQCSVDWIVVDFVALRAGLAALGRVRYIMKHALVYLPFYGYALSPWWILLSSSVSLSRCAPYR